LAIAKKLPSMYVLCTCVGHALVSGLIWPTVCRGYRSTVHRTAKVYASSSTLLEFSMFRFLCRGWVRANKTNGDSDQRPMHEAEFFFQRAARSSWINKTVFSELKAYLSQKNEIQKICSLAKYDCNIGNFLDQIRTNLTRGSIILIIKIGICISYARICLEKLFKKILWLSFINKFNIYYWSKLHLEDHINFHLWYGGSIWFYSCNSFFDCTIEISK
jgi:hypothetical protein